MWWSYILSAVGVFGLFLAGKEKYRSIGWRIGIGAQLLWIAYATATEQYGFYFSALAYGWVYTLNWWRSKHASSPDRKSRLGTETNSDRS